MEKTSIKSLFLPGCVKTRDVYSLSFSSTKRNTYWRRVSDPVPGGRGEGGMVVVVLVMVVVGGGAPGRYCQESSCDNFSTTSVLITHCPLLISVPACPPVCQQVKLWLQLAGY